MANCQFTGGSLKLVVIYIKYKLDDFMALVELIGDRDAKKSISALVAVCHFAWKRWTKVPFLAENPDVSS